MTVRVINMQQADGTIITVDYSRSNNSFRVLKQYTKDSIQALELTALELSAITTASQVLAMQAMQSAQVLSPGMTM